MQEPSRIRLGDFRTTDSIRRNINRVLESGRISYGPMCGEFESRFALLHSGHYGVLSNSGTSSLQVALQALKEEDEWANGCEVIVPSITFVATVNAVLHNNLAPVFVDVDPKTFAINPDLIEEKITKNTVCIVPVHPFGMTCNMFSISKIADKHDFRIVEDACETLFVEHAGTSVGMWGDIGCFSFYIAHILTMGVGGIGITDNEKLALRMRSLVNHGIEHDSLPTSSFYDPSHLGRHFRFDSIGHSFRITELEAAIGLAQLDHIESVIWDRKKNRNYITDKLVDLVADNLISLQELPDSDYDTAAMVFPIVSENKYITSKVAINYLRGYGIESREMLPLLNQPCYANLVINHDDYPVAKKIEEYGFYVPCHQFLSEYELDYMIQVIHSLFDAGDPPV